ncbi:MAG TPA: hypothetical protein VG329_08485 [Candidatus Dormibacteraeota bacterium]|nr:hypothetical protein [Candidatus Dormibacteraeota bacterium]
MAEVNRAGICRLALVIGAVVALSGCVPTVTVQNNTKIPVRVVVSNPGGGAETFSPSPGESSNGDLAPGAYTVTVIPDTDWTSYATQSRQALNDQLANSQNLTGPQLLAVVQRLKDLAARMDQMQKSAGAGASCGGSVTEDSAATATISIGADGKLVIGCK